MTSLSVVMPVYNEVGLLADAVRQIHLHLARNFTDFEILLVESGSNDGSYELCDELAREASNVCVIHEGARNGFGSALKLGYRSASKEAVCLVTADIPFPLQTLEKAVPLLAQYDCILSYRSEDPRALSRRIQSIVYNLLVKTVLGLRVRHVNSAFKLFRTEMIRALPIESNGWFIDTEVVARLQQGNVRFTEIPVPLIERASGQSSITRGTQWTILREVFRFRFRRSVS